MSQSYNKAERIIAVMLSRYPAIKNIAKVSYQYLNYLLYSSSYKIRSKCKYQVLGLEGQSSFFGYYDKRLQNKSFTHQLYHSVNYKTTCIPNPSKPVFIVLGDLKSGGQQVIAETYSYNWQQGSRLQWLTDDLFIFNGFDEVNKKYISTVLSKESWRKVKEFDFPVQDTFKTDYFLSLNYRRLLALRPDYGYRNLPPLNEMELQRLKNDGIWYIDYKTGDAKLLISLERIVAIKPDVKFDKALHYVNHIMISPDGRHFIFLHRYIIRGKRFDRLMISDQHGNHVSVLADNKMVSHCCWVDEDNILGYLKCPEGKTGFYLINIHNKVYINWSNGKLDSQGDGHPHVHGDWFVCDSYPDKSRIQNLTLNNLNTGESIKIAELFHGFKFHNETRCDLHPRFSPDGKKIYIDTVFSGKRKIVSLDVSQYTAK